MSILINTKGRLVKSGDAIEHYRQKQKLTIGKPVENLDDKLKEDKTFKLQDRISFRGLDIAVENKKGSVRKGVDDDGEEWRTKMFYPYGYIRGTMGVDGDAVDCFVGHNKESDKVFVIHQQHPENGKFDEDKVMLGFDDWNHARDAYLAHYNDQNFLGDHTEMDFDTFKEKVYKTKNKPGMIKSLMLKMKKSLEGNELSEFNNNHPRDGKGQFANKISPISQKKLNGDEATAIKELFEEFKKEIVGTYETPLEFNGEKIKITIQAGDFSKLIAIEGMGRKSFDELISSGNYDWGKTEIKDYNRYELLGVLKKLLQDPDEIVVSKHPNIKSEYIFKLKKDDRIFYLAFTYEDKLITAHPLTNNRLDKISGEVVYKKEGEISKSFGTKKIDLLSLWARRGLTFRNENLLLSEVYVKKNNPLLLYKSQFNLFGGESKPQLNLFQKPATNTAGKHVGDTKEGKHGTLIIRKNPSGHGAHVEYVSKDEAVNRHKAIGGSEEGGKSKVKGETEETRIKKTEVSEEPGDVKSETAKVKEQKADQEQENKTALSDKTTQISAKYNYPAIAAKLTTKDFTTAKEDDVYEGITDDNGEYQGRVNDYVYRKKVNTKAETIRITEALKKAKLDAHWSLDGNKWTVLVANVTDKVVAQLKELKNELNASQQKPTKNITPGDEAEQEEKPEKLNPKLAMGFDSILDLPLADDALKMGFEEFVKENGFYFEGDTSKNYYKGTAKEFYDEVHVTTKDSGENEKSKAEPQDKVKARLDDKQKDKQFKDVNERVPMSKKEMAAFRVLTLAELSKLDEASAFTVVTKDRLIPELDIAKLKEDGEASGLIWFKKKLRDLVSQKPANNDAARKVFVEKLPQFFEEINDAKTIDDIINSFRDKIIAKRKNWRSESKTFRFEKEADLKDLPLEDVFGKAFCNFVTMNNDTAREQVMNAKLMSEFTEEEARKSYDDSIKRGEEFRAKRFEAEQKYTDEKWGNELVSESTYPFMKEMGLGYSDVSKARREEPAKFAEMVEKYKQYRKERIENAQPAYSSYEDFVGKSPKNKPRENNWDWMNGEKKEREVSKDLKIHDNPPLSFIKRENGREVKESEINPETITNEFGFKSVQLGHYVKDNEAKEHIRHFIASLKDMEDALGIDLKKLQAEGGLSIAFGARGGGKALAHYEPNFKIINITKTKGDGSVAHEWLHYFDHFIGGGGIDTNNRTFATHKPADPNDEISIAVNKVVEEMNKGIGTVKKTYEPRKDKSYINGLESIYKNEGLEGAIQYIGKRMNPKFRDHSFEILARIHGKPIEVELPKKTSDFMSGALSFKSDYWKRPLEMFARAGEAYVQDKLAGKEMYNNYLVSGNDSSAEDAKWAAEWLNKTYPQGEERKRINAAFDNLFDVVRKKGFAKKIDESEKRVGEYVDLQKSLDLEILDFSGEEEIIIENCELRMEN